LADRNIPFSANMFKTKLCEFTKLKNPHFSCYKVDNLLAKHIHSVLHLPHYHPELNPIEKIWALLKDRVVSCNLQIRRCCAAVARQVLFSDTGGMGFLMSPCSIY
jgi:hypothetical protein